MQTISSGYRFPIGDENDDYQGALVIRVYDNFKAYSQINYTIQVSFVSRLCSFLKHCRFIESSLMLLLYMSLSVYICLVEFYQHFLSHSHIRTDLSTRKEQLKKRISSESQWIDFICIFVYFIHPFYFKKIFKTWIR